MADAATRERWEQFRRIDAAFKGSDLNELRAALGSTEGFPNDLMPPGTGGLVLECAIYHSPFPLIRALLEAGADPNPPEGRHAGFPPLHAALTKLRRVPGSMPRDDVRALLRLLLSHGADPNQRGLNDWTPLHVAALAGSAEAVGILLDAGADPRLRTRIDDCLTPREEVEKAGLSEMARLLAAAEAGRP
jgi:ankyrin repeat protein